MNNIFVPVAEIDLNQFPNGKVSFQLKAEGTKMVVYMALMPIPQTPPFIDEGV